MSRTRVGSSRGWWPCCASPTHTACAALELCFRVAYYGRRELFDALLGRGLVKRLLCLQRIATDAHVEAKQGLRPREKHAV